MVKQELRVREELSEILVSKNRPQREQFVRDMSAFLWTESKRIDDLEREELLRDNQLVFVVR